MKRIALVLTAGAALALAPSASPSSAGGSGTHDFAVDGGHLRVAFCTEDVVRVAFAREVSFFDRKSLAAGVRRCEDVRVGRTDASGHATLATSRMKVRVDLATGQLAFLDAQGALVLAEKKGGRSLPPAEVQGEKTFQPRQEWSENEDESLYGLGQQQLGLLDLKGYDLDLWQRNATVVVPFLVSSRGYGILWDNTSYTRFGDLRPWEPVPPSRLFDATGQPGGLTGTYYRGAAFETQVATRVDPRVAVAVPGGAKEPNLRIHPSLPPEGEASVRWEGAVEATEAGEHLFQLYSNGGIRMWVDGRLVADHWRQGWLPWIDLARVSLDKGKHALKIEWSKDQGMETVRLLWKTPARERSTSLWSEVGDGVDYTFVYGPSLDRVTAGYRRLTGEAPMMPRWAFGLWQSRQRYETQAQSLDAVDGFRSRRIPFDNIVQDWFYWPENAWGSHHFDPVRFPDPDGWVRAVHERNARLMISVWGKFYPGTENFEAMRSKGFLYESTLRSGFKDWVGPGYPYTFFDAFTPAARKLFWAQVDRDLFRRGFDAWWMDATEPDLLPTPDLDAQRAHMHPTAMGTGSRVLNAYPLLNSQGVYEGQRATAPDQRVFILTRSAFAGQQRYAAATWSGDITSTWTAMRQQIPGGLNFSLSGIPYWTVDIGGFSVPGRFSRKDPRPEDVEEWRELNARWFEYGTFLPITRVHGEAPKREMWEMGGEAHPAYQAHPQVRPAALPDAALRVLPGRGGDPRGGHLPATARHGLPGRRSGTPRRGPVPLRPRVPRQPRDRAPGPATTGRPAAGRVVVRLLDGTGGRRRADDRRASTLRRDAGPRAGGVDRAVRAGAPVDGGEAGRPGDAVRLRGRRRGLRPLRGRRPHVRLREGRLLPHPPPLERRHGHAHHREARGLVPGDARAAHVRGGPGREGEARRLLVRAEARPHGAVRRRRGRGAVRVRRRSIQWIEGS